MDSGNREPDMDSGNREPDMDSGNREPDMDSGNREPDMDSGNREPDMDSGHVEARQSNKRRRESQDSNGHQSTDSTEDLMLPYEMKTKKEKLELPVRLEKFYDAVKNRRIDMINDLLEEDNSVFVQAVEEEGWTPLHRACIQHNVSKVALLLSENADYQVKNNLGLSSFDIAKEFLFVDIIKLFIKDKQNLVTSSQVDHVLRLAVVISDLELMDLILTHHRSACNETDENGNTILHMTVNINKFEATKRLVNGGVKVNCENNNKQTPLLVASILNATNQAIFLLQSDPKTVNCRDLEGNTALHFAAQKGNAALINELIEEGANVNMTNKYGMTPLHYAIQCHWSRAFYTLLDYAELNTGDKNGNTPLHLSVIEKDHKMTKSLVKHHANVNCLNIYGQTPLHIAVDRNDEDMIHCLLDRTSFNLINAADSLGNTLLHIATLRENCALIEEFVKKGAMLDVTNANGHSPLHIAILFDCQKSFHKLTSLGANVNVKDSEGKTPLHFAVSKGVLSVVGQLMNSGADLELRDNYGQTPIYYAANCESLEVLKHLYLSGAKASINFCQQTLIHVAVESCPYSGIPDKVCRKCWYVIEWLLCMNVDIKAQDMKGETALHYGARYSCVSLLDHLCDLDFETTETLLKLKNEDGQTALHVAALWNWQVFDYLLGENADPDLKDNRNVTPLEILIEKYECMEEPEVQFETSVHPQEPLPMIHYFVSLRLQNIVELLLNRTSCLESRCNGETPLMFAVNRGLKQETQYFIDKGADINAKNNDGFSALHIAILNSDKAKVYINIAHSLIIAGADINIKSQDGKSPLHLALQKERVYPFLLRNLLENGAIVDALDSEKKTPLDYISPENMENPLVKTLIRHCLIMLKTVDMLSIPIDFPYNGFENFHKCCLEEIEQMKAEKHGRNSLLDVFFKFGNPTYIFNERLETKIRSIKKDDNTEYLIYGSALKVTFQRAKDRYKLLQDAQGFFGLLKNYPHPVLPEEIQRTILYNLCDSDLETLVELSQKG